MQRPNATVHREQANRRTSDRRSQREEEGGRSKERSVKGRTRVKMVEEMACKRGFVGKRTEPVVRRHLVAPYIFLFLSRLISLPRTVDATTVSFFLLVVLFRPTFPPLPSLRLTFGLHRSLFRDKPITFLQLSIPLDNFGDDWLLRRVQFPFSRSSRLISRNTLAKHHRNNVRSIPRASRDKLGILGTQHPTEQSLAVVFSDDSQFFSVFTEQISNYLHPENAREIYIASKARKTELRERQ